VGAGGQSGERLGMLQRTFVVALLIQFAVIIAETIVVLDLRRWQ
jgi:hypothetical protein